jgi:hypothetical protein
VKKNQNQKNPSGKNRKINLAMVTGIKLLSQQQVINSNTMGLSGLSSSQIPSQEAPMKRATSASDTRRVSKFGGTEKRLRRFFYIAGLG